MDSHVLLREVVEAHFPRPPASPEEIARFEARVGWRFDGDLRAFYLRCNGADLFGHPNPAYRILPLSGIKRAREAILGSDDASAGPSSWYAICADPDLDYMAVDVSAPIAGKYPVYDCWHEVFPDPQECRRIAGSFGEFLERALRSGGAMYWLANR